MVWAVIFLPALLPAQGLYVSIIDSFRVGDIKVTIDRPSHILTTEPMVVCIYALPNGNTTEQSMGKKLQPGDDWHFDIQHIQAQTEFVRHRWPYQALVVIYLENEQKSWPRWKQVHPDFAKRIPHMVDSLYHLFKPKKKWLYLNGHSGGGSFIFGYMAGMDRLPAYLRRISFLDSDYGYDSTYYPKLRDWLRDNKKAALTVFAYNDSVALYNGKPVVSATGGTWYRSHLLLRHLAADYSFEKNTTDSIDSYSAGADRIRFFFKPNYNQGIYHTQQVELNGFIHSLLCGTKEENRGYEYYGKRAYEGWIR